jgi:hypothetical protein
MTGRLPARAPVALALGALLAAGCAAFSPLPSAPRASPRKPAAERDLLDLVPATAEALLWLDVSRLRASVWSRPVFAWAVERQRTASGRQGFRGFDEIADVDRWLFARTGADTMELAEGRLDRKLVESTFRSKRPAATSLRRGSLDLLADAQQGLLFVSPRRVVLGPVSAVTAAADVAGDRAPAATDDRWLAAARAALDDEAGPRGATVATELALLPTAPVRQEVAGWLGREPRLEYLAARLALGTEARLTMVAVASDRQEARLLADRLTQVLRALAGRRSLRALGLGPAFQRARVGARGARLVLELLVTASERELVSNRLTELADILNPPPPLDPLPGLVPEPGPAPPASPSLSPSPSPSPP